MKLFIAFVLSFTCTIVQAQDYWQQEVNYSIQVELLPEKKQLKANVEIEYNNNSPHTLNEVYIHLWPNAYSTNKSRFSKQLLTKGDSDFYLSRDRGSITNLQFKVDGISVSSTKFENAADIAVLSLNEPLLPGESVSITTPFTVNIPRLVSRLGVDSEIFHLTQWFPKAAVYDTQGWHPMPYLDWGEYYSNFGEYEVEITLPSNYVVAATGELQTLQEKKWLEELADATRKGIQQNYEFSEVENLKQREAKKTIIYKQNDIHDFAWFASTRFLLLEDSIKIGERDVKLQSYFPEEDVFLWEQANGILENSMRYFSQKIGTYPYSNYKAVGASDAAGAGMEYPMLTVLQQTASELNFKKTLIHEVAHSWFHGMIASNERDFAWMDEGFTHLYTELYLAQEIDVKDYPVEYNYNILEPYIAGFNIEPIQGNAEDYLHTDYVISSYYNAATALNYLREYLGTDQFEQTIKEYFRQWQLKHPRPSDLQTIFEQNNNKNLDWFFDILLLTDDILDYKLKSVKDGQVKIKNKSDLPFPFTLDYLDEDENRLYTEWIDGFTGEKSFPLRKIEGAEEVTIFSRPVYFEYNRSNNSKKIKSNSGSGVHLITPLNQSFSEGTGSLEKKELFVSPLAGFNGYDGLQLGGMITNTSLLEKKFEYQLLPLYAFESEDITGLAEIRAHFYPKSNSVINQIEAYTRFRHFNYTENYELDYYRNQLGATVHFNHSGEQPNFIHKSFNANWVMNVEEQFPDLTLPEPVANEYGNDHFFNLSYERRNSRKINPNAATVTAQGNENFLRLAGEYNYRYDFAKKGEYAKFRVFGGGIFAKDEAPFQTNFSAIGRSGRNDYDLSGLYFYRGNEDSFLNQAWTEADGALKLQENYAFPVDYYGDKMAAINAEVTIPFELPVGKLLAFSDVSVFTKSLGNTEGESAALYDAGLSYQVGDILKIYYPLLLSDEFKPNTDIEKFGFADKLIFAFNFNPLDIKNNLRRKINQKP